MIIDLNRLRTFVTVAQAGSITNAAIKLHLTQQAVSSQIQLLEQDLGMLLFKRANRRVYLSKDGRALLEIARPRIEAVEQDILTLADDISSLQTTITIGASNEIADAFLVDAIIAFRKIYPGISFAMELNNDSVTEAGILDGKLDLGVMVFTKELKLLHIKQFRRERFLTVASRTYLERQVLAIKGFKDILSHDVLDFEPWCPSLKTWILKNDKKLLSHFEHKTACIATNDDRLIKRMVLQDMGIASLPETLVKEELERGELVEILPETDKIEAGIDIVSMKHRTEHLAVKTFIEFLFSDKS